MVNGALYQACGGDAMVAGEIEAYEHGRSVDPHGDKVELWNLPRS